MKLFKEGLVRIDCGSAFHNFEAEYEKERSYNAVRDLGTERSPFSDDLKERVWISDTGLSRPDIYAGAKLFSALYVNTALLYIKRLGTESHSSLSNMIVEGVIKSALNMIRQPVFVTWRDVQYLRPSCFPKCCSHNQVVAVYNFDRISFEYSGVRISRCV